MFYDYTEELEKKYNFVNLYISCGEKQNNIEIYLIVEETGDMVSYTFDKKEMLELFNICFLEECIAGVSQEVLEKFFDYAKNNNIDVSLTNQKLIENIVETILTNLYKNEFSTK